MSTTLNANGKSLTVGVPQCAYCQSGQIMATVALLKQNPRPSDDRAYASNGASIAHVPQAGGRDIWRPLRKIPHKP